MGSTTGVRLGRRELCLGAATSALMACKRRSSVIPDVDPDIGEKVVPETIAVGMKIKAGQKDALHAQLEQHVFEHPTGGVHYLRMLPMDDDTLLLSAVFDSDINALLSLCAENATRLDKVLQHVEGYPESGAADLSSMHDFLEGQQMTTMLLYSAFNRASEPAVREATQLRTEFLKFVRNVQRNPGAAETCYTNFLEANKKRIDTHSEGAVDQLTPAALTAPNRQNPFTMVFDLKEDWVKRLNKTLTDGQWFLDNLHIHPLKKIPTVHYARFARIHRTKILFESVYDGEWEQYVSDFAVHIPTQLDLVWGGAVGYPAGGAADAPALAKFLEDHRLERDYFYMAYSDETVKEIQASLALGQKLVTFSKDAPSEAAGLVKHVDRFVHRHQELLG
ncbi:MAG: hypothetical protein AAGA54_22010 [Myxococcota bacterium]